MSFVRFVIAFMVLTVTAEAEAPWDSWWDYNELVPAIHAEREANVERLIKNGADVNLPTERQEIPLIEAVKLENNGLVKILLAAGANTEVVFKGATPLMWAAAQGSCQIIETLKSFDAHLDATDTHGNTAVAWAVKNSQEKAVRVLAESGATIEIHNNRGKTPLMLGAGVADLNTLQALLESGARLENIDNEGRTPLFDAVSSCNVGNVKFLLDAGAQMNREDSKGMTPLMEAAVKGCVGAARHLIDAGADIYAETKRDVVIETFDQGILVHAIFGGFKTHIPAGANAYVFAEKFGKTAMMTVLQEADEAVSSEKKWRDF